MGSAYSPLQARGRQGIRLARAEVACRERAQRVERTLVQPRTAAENLS